MAERWPTGAPAAPIVPTTVIGVLALVLDTSAAAVTAGVVDCAGSRVLAERVTVNGRAHGELLAPSVRDCLAEARLAPTDLAAVVAGVGPGPFTGLRVGLVTAAAISDALGLPSYPVCSLDAIAAAHPDRGRLLVAGDARRKEIYWALYRDGERLTEPAVGKPAELPADLNATAAAGAGARLYAELLALPVLDGDYPSVAALAALARDRVLGSAAGEPLNPLYLRRPDAMPVAGRPAMPVAGEPATPVERHPAAITLRPMRTADLDALLPHEQDLFGSESWSRQGYLDELSDTELRHYLVAEQDGTVVGSAGLLTIGETAQIVTVGVLPAARRQGVGGRLIRALVAEAARRRASEVLLEVRIDNAAARQLYAKLGFEVIGTRRGYYDQGRVDAVVMRRGL
ncbi:MAG: tRNA (adenosine(37)-N6)-threonylcarbamoyltransferase complex dimerization subunit type 1 TsaB [Jatrophihabitantaceae bacterium]